MPKFYKKINLIFLFVLVAFSSLKTFAQIDPLPFQLGGNAFKLNDTCFRLTQAQSNQNGRIWCTDKITLAAPFTIHCQLNFGANDSNGADGIAFLWQSSASGTAASGTGGGGIGYQGIAPSIGVEFDTYHNGSPYNDPATFDHIAVMRNGNPNHASTDNLAGPIGCLPGNINVEDNTDHDVVISWDPATNIVEVYFDNILRISQNIGDIVGNTFGCNPDVWFGFTGSTGALSNVQVVCIEGYSFTKVIDTLTVCNGSTVQLNAPDGSNWVWSPSTNLDDPNAQNPICNTTTDITYTLNFTTLGGCASSLERTVEVLPTFSANQNVNVCPSDLPYILPDNTTASSTGTYVATLVAANGCDSIITTNLTVLNEFTTNNPQIICQHQLPYTLPNGGQANGAGNWPVTLTASNGCDSVVITQLTVNPDYTQTVDAQVCPSSLPYNLPDGSQVNTNGVYSVTLPTINSCDSTIITTLTILPNFTVDVPVAICENDLPYQLPDGSLVSLSGNYPVLLTASNGCDSLITTQLTVNFNSTNTLNPQICDGDAFTVGTNTYTTSGTYTDILINAAGCDSIITTNLTANNNYSQIIPIAICQSQTPYLLPDGTNVFTSGTYDVVLPTIYGCDSLISTQLTINPESNITLNPQICNGDVFTVGTNTYTTTGTYTDVLIDAAGCDSTITTNLTVTAQINVNNPQTICNGSSYTIGNSTYTADGIYQDLFTSVGGCDSVVTTQLTVLPAIIASNDITICNGASYSIGNSTYTTTGTYTDVLQASNGCDSTVTTNLTVVNLTITLDVAQQASCNLANGALSVSVGGNGLPPFTYLWSPGGYTTEDISNLPSGNYTLQITDALGCTQTASFTLNDSPPASLILTNQINPACGQANGEITVSPTGGTGPFSYTWSHNASLNSPTATGLNANTYTVTVTDALGCTAQLSISLPNSAAATANIVSTTNATCNQANASADIEITGGLQPFNFVWMPGNINTEDLVNVPSGNYVLTATDAAGCQTTLSLTLTDSPPVSFVLINQQNTTCSQANGILELNITNGTPNYTYNWSPNVSNSNIASGLNAGTYNITVTDAAGCIATQSFTLADSPAPNIIVANIIPASCGVDNGAIDLETENGTAPFVYEWSPSLGNNPDITDLPAGFYSVTVTDANNCTDSETIEIVNPSAPEINLVNVSNAGCGQTDGRITVSVSGGTGVVNITWLADDGSSGNVPADGIIDGLPAGNYTFTAQDETGCTDVLVVTVVGFSNPDLVLVSSNPATCGLNNGFANINNSAGSNAGTWLWTPNVANTNNPNNLPPGSYTVFFTDANGCTDQIDLTIDAQASPDIANVITTESNCGASDGTATLQVTAGGAPITTYTWLPNVSNTISANNLSAGVYSVTVTDANGCTDTIGFNIVNLGAPSISLTNSTNAACGQASGSLSFTANGGQPPYTWQPGNLSGNNVTYNNLLAGTYSTTVTDANGCAATLTGTVGSVNGPTLTLIAQADAHCGLSDGSITVQVSAGSNLSWQPIGSGTKSDNLPAGTYTITATDANGCTAILNVTLNDIVGVSISLVNSVNTSCGNNNGSIETNANGGVLPYTFKWSHNALLNSPNATNLLAGTYSVTVTDASGCEATLSQNLTDSAGPVLSPGNNTPANCGQNNGSLEVLVPGNINDYTFLWNTTPPQNTATASGLGVGTYTVTVTDLNGCSSSLTLSISNIGAPQITIDNSTNPTCGQANGEISISATGGNGTLIYSWSPTPNNTNSISNLPAGVYSVSVTDQDGCQATAVIVLIDQQGAILSLVGLISANCGQANGSAEVAALGGTSPIDFVWNSVPMQNMALASNLSSGNYTVTATDANGCTSFLDVFIPDIAGPSLNIKNITPEYCGLKNGAAILETTGGTPPYNYDWPDFIPDGSAAASNLVSGNYDVTVTDSKGCTSVITVIIPIADPMPLVFGGVTDATCGTSNGSITIDTTGKLQPCTFTWSHDANLNSPVATNLSAGNYLVTITDALGCAVSGSTLVAVSNGPQIALDAILPEHCGKLDGGVEITISGGMPPYILVWNNGMNSEDLYNVTCGTYSVTVTDALGCETLGNYDINCIAAPDLSIASINDATCNKANGSIATDVLGGNGTLVYTWSHNPGLNNPDATNLLAGNYTVTVTDSNGCSDIASAIIGDSPPVQIALTASQAEHCGLKNGFAETQTTGGTNPCTYTWSHDATLNNPNAINLSAGNYIVTVTDAKGCTATLNITIDAVDGPSITITNGTALCATPEGSVSANVSNGSLPYSYLWNTSPVQTSATATNLLPGVYSVTVTDSFGCLATASATVVGSLPPVVVNCGTITNTSIEFVWDAIAGALDYSYSTSTGLNGSTTDTTLLITGLTDGQTVSITIIVNGPAECGNSAEATVSCTTENYSCPPNPITVTGVLPTYCIDAEPVTLNFEPVGGSFGDSSGIVGNLFYANMAGVGTHDITYTLVQNIGSTVCSYDTTIQITVVPLPNPEVILPDYICLGDDLTLLVSGNINPDSQFEWKINGQVINNNSGPFVYKPITTGNYEVQLTETTIAGCSASMTKGVIVSAIEEVKLLAADTAVLKGGTVLLTANGSSAFGGELTYTWSPEIICSNNNCNEGVATITANSTYLVTITDSFGCQDEAEITINVLLPNVVNIPTAFSPNNDGFNDVFVPAGNNILNYNLLIYDRWGKIIFNGVALTATQGWNGMYQNSTLQAEVGVYVLVTEITFNDGKKQVLEGNLTLVR